MAAIQSLDPSLLITLQNIAISANERCHDLWDFEVLGLSVRPKVLLSSMHSFDLRIVVIPNHYYHKNVYSFTSFVLWIALQVIQAAAAHGRKSVLQAWPRMSLTRPLRLVSCFRFSAGSLYSVSSWWSRSRIICFVSHSRIAALLFCVHSACEFSLYSDYHFVHGGVVIKP